MPKRDEISNELLMRIRQIKSYSLRIEGDPAILRKNLVASDDLAVGEKVKLFSLPDGRSFLAKVKSDNPEGFTIGKITPAHIYFEDDIALKET